MYTVAVCVYLHSVVTYKNVSVPPTLARFLQDFSVGNWEVHKTARIKPVASVLGEERT